MPPVDTTSRRSAGTAHAGRVRRGLIISAIAFAVLILVLAGSLLISLRHSLQPAHRSTDQHSYSGTRSLHVHTDSTDVTLRAASGAAHAVTVSEQSSWTNRRPEVTHTRHGDALTLRAGCPFHEMNFGFPTCHVALTVTVPAGVPVVVDNSSGDVSVRGLTQRVTVRASSGDIHLARLSGPVDAQVSSGDVHAETLTGGHVRAVADSGDVSLSFDRAPRTVTSRADSGNVTVLVPHNPDGYDVSSAVSSGDRRIDVRRARGAPHHIRAVTSSGDVTVGYR